jgi:hypothetical protein
MIIIYLDIIIILFFDLYFFMVIDDDLVSHPAGDHSSDECGTASILKLRHLLGL